MATPTTTGAAGGNPVIPLISKIDMNTQPMAKLVYERQDGNNKIKHQTSLPCVSEETEPELISRLIRDFRDQIPNNRMHLSTGTLRFKYFRECLGGTARDYWDECAADQQNETIGTFDNAMTAFIRKYLSPTDLSDLLKYLDTTRKPWGLTVPELVARVKLINRLTVDFPGANGVEAMTLMDNACLVDTLLPDSTSVQLRPL